MLEKDTVCTIVQNVEVIMFLGPGTFPRKTSYCICSAVLKKKVIEAMDESGI